VPDDFAPDELGQRLRAGAEQLGTGLSPRAASLIRARGDQRRHRKIAGSLALAFVLIAGGGGGTAYALSQHGPHAPGPLAPGSTITPTPAPAPSHPVTLPPGATTSPAATGSPGPTGTTSPPGATATTTTMELGPLLLRVPATWRVTYHDAQGDYTVSTGSCAGDNLIGAEGGSPCSSFSLIADAGPTTAPAPGTHTYVPGQEYTTSTGATGCPAKPTASWWRDAPAVPSSTGYAPVTSTKTADYTVWQFGCYHGAGTPKFYFQQRDWYLPDSKILIIDEYATPGLAQILAAATWIA
jgi:hypothetical protein